MAVDRWGVSDGYLDVRDAWHPTPPATVAALHRAMGVSGTPTGAPGHGSERVDDTAHTATTQGPSTQGPSLRFVREGAATRLQGPHSLLLEDGSDLGVLTQLPPDLPIGDHELTARYEGTTTHLVVTPDHCHLPENLRQWGWTAQLYATRSGASWGHGDLGDLRTLTTMAAAQGAGFVAINPLHATRTLPSVQACPYYPTSRCWSNPLYLRIEEVTGFGATRGELADDLADLAAAGRALNSHRIVDHDRVWALKLPALEALWRRFATSSRHSEFAAWRSTQGQRLQLFATFCVLEEHHQQPWPRWPVNHRHPDDPAVASFAAEHEDRVAFHAWLQWLLAGQLAAACAAGPVVADLAVGFDPAGADGWRWQDLLALDARIGAPPDEFNPAGQDWGSPPFVPSKLRAAHYQPFREVLDGLCRGGGGVRIDHVMGLFRLFWLPPDRAGGDGAYVHFAGQELLDLVALASIRHRTTIVGEDLGTVGTDIRAALRGRRVLSTRLVWFERDPPSRFPAESLASLSTHDLPTVAGLLSGYDAEDRARTGAAVDPEGDASLRANLATAAGVADVDELSDFDPVPIVQRVCSALSACPSALVAASFEDALGVTERPNLPGTLDEQRPNWRFALPVPLEHLPSDPGVRQIADAFSERR